MSLCPKWNDIERGHNVVAPDLPSEDASAGLAEYADAVVDVIGDRGDLVVVAQSVGGLLATSPQDGL
jgi:pimeloyl-ACP methyl ester carboxylesterase